MTHPRPAIARSPLSRSQRARWAHGILLAATGLMMAACGPRQPPSVAYGHWSERPDVKAQATAASQNPTTPTGEAASPAPAQATVPPPPTETRQAALPPGTQKEPPPEPPRLEELQGLNSGQLTMLLGKPTLLRQDASAQLWQYRSESCVLYLFLYPAGGDVHVQHAETRARQTGAPAVTTGPSECLATLIGARWTQS